MIVLNKYDCSVSTRTKKYIRKSIPLIDHNYDPETSLRLKSKCFNCNKKMHWNQICNVCNTPTHSKVKSMLKKRQTYCKKCNKFSPNLYKCECWNCGNFT